MTVSDLVHSSMGDFTASERKVATALLADYPFAGLLTVAELSRRANVSGQSTLRFTAKLGFDGYAGFQRHLIGELKAGLRSPVALRVAQAEPSGDRPFLEQLAERVQRANQETLAGLNASEFEAVSAKLADRRRAVYLLGGRMSDSLAAYFHVHLRQIRPKVYHVPSFHEDWPDVLLRLKRNDLLVLFDFRRYQRELLAFAEQATRSRKAVVVLFTDKWLSPIARISSHILPVQVEVGTPWDTAVSAVLLIEALFTRVAEENWPVTQSHIKQWDALRLQLPRRDEEPD